MLAKSAEKEIAQDQLEDLRKNTGRCISISVHTGRHPWVRWDDEIGRYIYAEQAGTGRLEIESATEEKLVELLAENPVNVIPASKAMFSPREPGRANVWDYARRGGENVICADEMATRYASCSGVGER